MYRIQALVPDLEAVLAPLRMELAPCLADHTNALQGLLAVVERDESLVGNADASELIKDMEQVLHSHASSSTSISPNDMGYR